MWKYDRAGKGLATETNLESLQATEACSNNMQSYQEPVTSSSQSNQKIG